MMPLEVIGAGFGRTGTMSLQAALDILLKPGKCYHFAEILFKGHIHLWTPALEAGTSPDWKQLFKDGNFVATCDHPVCEFWEELMVRFPDAKVILSEHPEGKDKWYDSKMALQAFQDAMRVWPIKPVVECVLPILLRQLGAKRIKYSWKELGSFAKLVEDKVWGPSTVYDKDNALRCYQTRIDDVKAKVPKDRLLVFNVKQGWKPLCEFLGKEEPNEPFPKEDLHGSKTSSRSSGARRRWSG